MLIQAHRGYAHLDRLGDFTARLLDELAQRDKKTWAKTLKTIVYNCWLSVVAENDNPGKELWVCYSRNKNDYQAGARYGRLHLSYDRLPPMVDRLRGDTTDGLGLIDHVMGDYEGHLMSKFRPVGELRALLQELVVKPKDLWTNRRYEVVELKDEDKNRIDYRDNAFTKGARRNIKTINRHNRR